MMAKNEATTATKRSQQCFFPLLLSSSLHRYMISIQNNSNKKKSMDKNTMFHLGAVFSSSSARTNERKKNCYVTPNINPNTEKPTRYTQSACCGGFIRSLAFSCARLLSRNISQGKTRLAGIRMTPSKLPFSLCCRCSVFVMSLTQSFSQSLARALAFFTFQQ